MVPFTIVPGAVLAILSVSRDEWGSWGSARVTDSVRTILEFDCDSLVLAFHEEPMRSD